MADLSGYPITQRWPASNPDILQLYSFPTPNGVKVSIMLEEIGLPYEAHRVTLSDADVKSPEFLSLNPNNKIPAILDPHGPNGSPVALFESGAILLYLAEKSGKLLPHDPNLRAETLSWLMLQMGGIGPMFGQIGYFHKYAGSAIEDPRPKQRYVDEGKRLLSVLDQRLEGREWLMGDTYTIADIATFPWVRNVDGAYGARDLLELERFANVTRWWNAAAERPASVRGLDIPSREALKQSA
ncbi:glutathione S-transferase N-terminal domain-containing protein [Oceanibium sediminis]|uniref:glutathione S-transferase N-terminal domain-containing protein n=1 Tax=Oceanibium sediminis TaxID=2026339 RepID=UPI000DD4C9F8|nr:glutathione S-transferase N-terminal domain-containing protein [Oceanibium sediminis]